MLLNTTTARNAEWNLYSGISIPPPPPLSILEHYEGLVCFDKQRFMGAITELGELWFLSWEKECLGDVIFPHSGHKDRRGMLDWVTVYMTGGGGMHAWTSKNKWQGEPPG